MTTSKDVPLEKAEEDYLREQCKKAGFLCWKFTVPNVAGVPDRMILGNGQLRLAELKRPGGKPRPLQLARFREIQRLAGTNVVVIDSHEATDAFIREMQSYHP